MTAKKERVTYSEEDAFSARNRPRTVNGAYFRLLLGITTWAGGQSTKYQLLLKIHVNVTAILLVVLLLVVMLIQTLETSAQGPQRCQVNFAYPPSLHSFTSYCHNDARN